MLGAVTSGRFCSLGIVPSVAPWTTEEHLHISTHAHRLQLRVTSLYVSGVDGTPKDAAGISISIIEILDITGR